MIYAPFWTNRVAGVHTHPTGSGIGTTALSIPDIEWENHHQIPIYVHGPNGKIRKYDPSTGKDIELDVVLPESPYKPWIKG